MVRSLPGQLVLNISCLGTRIFEISIYRIQFCKSFSPQSLGVSERRCGQSSKPQYGWFVSKAKGYEISTHRFADSI